MTPETIDVVRRRLRNQRLTQSRFRTAADVVAWFGAVQAQEYAIAKWALAQRTGAATDADVERAFTSGAILRTHVMRPTWHFVTPGDIKWMLALTAPRVNKLAVHYERRLGLDAQTCRKSNDAIARALEGGVHLTRAEIGGVLARAGIEAAGQRLGHVMMRAELDQIVCSGPRRGKQFTYALLDERAPDAGTMSRDESLAELVRRYFRSHGPATVKDFVWWSGLTVADARAGIELIRPALAQETIGGLTYWSVPSRTPPPPEAPTAFLLPIYDEYLIAYRDRELVIGMYLARGAKLVSLDDYAFHVVLDGVLAGSWRRVQQGASTTVSVTPYRKLTRVDLRGLKAAAERFEAFLGEPVAITVADGKS